LLVQVPDAAHGTVGGRPIAAAVADDAWLRNEFISTVQQRGAAIIKAGSWACLCAPRWQPAHGMPAPSPPPPSA
jgi:malate/lactate dehydrogenase